MKGLENGHAKFKERAIEELKEFWITSLYLFIFLGAFTLYRRMVLAEFGVTYLQLRCCSHRGSRHCQGRPDRQSCRTGQTGRAPRALILPVVLKSGVFALLTILFAVLEHIVEGFDPQKGLGEQRSNLFGIGSLSSWLA